MGFIASGKGAKAARDGMPSIHLVHKLECRICPLDKVKGNYNPHMPPTGTDKPLIYVLGEAPGAAEDEDGKRLFIGKSGQLFRQRIPKHLLPLIRFNNVVRTRPPANRTPERIEIEACRPSIERDIVATKPKAIFGFGGVPLKWATDQNYIMQWRGRRMPVNIGGHVCWYYAFAHPALLLRQRRKGAIRATDIGSEAERAFTFDLKRAFAEVESLPPPRVWTRQEAEGGVELIECSQAGLDRVLTLLERSGKAPEAGVDYETRNTRPYGKENTLLTAAVSTPSDTFTFPIMHPKASWSDSQLQRLLEGWLIFLGSKCRKLVHHLAFEQEWSAYWFDNSIIRKGPWGCSMIQAACIDERFGDRKPGCLGLEFLVQQYFGFNLKSLSPLNRKDLGSEPLKDVLLYNGMDARFHRLLWLAQMEELKRLDLVEVYEETLRRVPSLVLTQIKGVPVDQAETRKLHDKYQARVEEVFPKIMALPDVKKAERLLGETFKPGSDKHVMVLLRDVLKRSEGIKEDYEGNEIGYSADEAVLTQINHPFCELLLRWRKANKVLSTYLHPYLAGSPTLWPDGMVHAIIHAIGTISHRSSSEEPNIQNIPKRNAEAKEVRKQIKAPKGQIIVAADHGQIQARGIAMMSKDKVFCKALWERYDIHTEWAERIARAYPKRVGGKQNFTDKKVMKAFRTDIKNQWTFPLFFGAQLESVAEYLNIPSSALAPEERAFWKMFDGVREWQEELLAQYQKEGFVRHIDGRLNRAPLSRNQVFNLPIQGIEHVIVFDGMNRLSERQVWDLQPMLEIHDDLTFMLPEKSLDDNVEIIVSDMLAAADRFPWVNVPLTVEVSVGFDLYAMEEVLVASSDTWKK